MALYLNKFESTSPKDAAKFGGNGHVLKKKKTFKDFHITNTMEVHPFLAGHKKLVLTVFGTK